MSPNSGFLFGGGDRQRELSRRVVGNLSVVCKELENNLEEKIILQEFLVP